MDDVRRSRTGPIREGLHYQDLYGTHISLRWLEHPSEYLWVTFEAQQFGSLDDVVVLRSSGILELIQVKHVAERTERPEFRIEDLIKQGGTQRSLFQKWFRSWDETINNAEYSRVEPVLYTNRPAAPELVSCCITKGAGYHIVPESLQDKHPVLYDSMICQSAADPRAVDEFLRTLSLRFDRPDIEPSEESLLERASTLNISPTGLSSLQDKIWIWATHRDPSGKSPRIMLDDIKRAAGWRTPLGIPEEFPIAGDYVPFSQELIEPLVADLTNQVQTTRILADVPGAGKSTFLASLHSHLLNKNIPCVRHHYYLRQDDAYIIERLSAARTADALIAELAKYMNSSVNPTTDKLRHVLKETAASLRADGQRLVVILDGLDHVLRGEDVGELSAILKQLLPAPDNCSLVFGTRLIPIPQIRQLLSAIPQEHWIQVPRMTFGNCIRMIKKNRVLKVSENEIDSVAARLLQISEGLPLHLHYSIAQLESLATGRYVYPSLVDQLAPYSGDLSQYYESIWNHLGAETRILGVVLAFAGFVVPKTALGDLFDGTSTELQRGYEQIKPLLKELSDGVTLFHSSFPEFISNHPDAQLYRYTSMQRLIRWLERSADLRLRWRWLGVKKYEIGDAEQLIREASRDWVVRSVIAGYDTNEIEVLLQLACHAAMERSDYPIALERGMLADYLGNSRQFEDDLWFEVESLARLISIDEAAGSTYSLDVTKETDLVLVELAASLDQKTVADICQELFRRFQSVFSERRLQDYKAQVKASAGHFITVSAIARAPVTGMLEFLDGFIPTFRDSLYEDYVGALLDSGQPSNALFVATHRSPGQSDAALIERIARRLVTSPLIAAPLNLGTGPWAELYEFATKRSVRPLNYVWPPPERFPESIARFDDQQQQSLSVAFQGAWLNGVLAGVSADRGAVDGWTSQLPSDRWTATAAKALAALGWLLGRDLFREDSDICHHLACLDEVEEIRPGEPSWDAWELWKAYRNALKTILEDLLALRAAHQKKLIDDNAFAALQKLNALTEQDLYDLFLNCSRTLFVQSPLIRFVGVRLLDLETRLAEFPQRARAYLEVAQVARRVGATWLSRQSLENAVSNALAYGSHKDLFLYHLISALKVAAMSQILPVDSYLDRIAPVANVIDEITDGDETGHLLEDFAELCMVCGRIGSAAAIYSALCADGRYFLSDAVFEEMAGSANLADTWVQSLLRTAVDRTSRARLKARAASDPLARQIVADLEALDHDPFLIIPAEADNDKDETERESQPKRLLDSLNERLSTANPPEKVGIGEFITFCREHVGDHGFDEFCKQWYSHWLPYDRVSTYRNIREVIDWPASGLFGGDIELELLPLVLEFDGQAAGFEFLVRTARALHIWNIYYTHSTKVQRALEFLMKHFPNRIDEFIRNTVESTAFHRRLGYLPVQRGVQLIAEAGRPELATRLIEAGVRVLEGAMANLCLPAVNWPSSEDQVLDAIFSRLYHVHPEVRSRGAIELGRLLGQEWARKRVFAAIEKRLSNTLLESEAVLLLYPVSLAKMSGVEVSVEGLRSSLRCGCAATELVFEGMG